jgi:hypothetical protein
MSIKERIEKLKTEQATLNKAHELLGQQAAKNQVRFQQITGALAELEEILKDEENKQHASKSNRRAA